LQKVRK